MDTPKTPKVAVDPSLSSAELKELAVENREREAKALDTAEDHEKAAASAETHIEDEKLKLEKLGEVQAVLEQKLKNDKAEQSRQIDAADMERDIAKGAGREKAEVEEQAEDHGEDSDHSPVLEMTQVVSGWSTDDVIVMMAVVSAIGGIVVAVILYRSRPREAPSAMPMPPSSAAERRRRTEYQTKTRKLAPAPKSVKK